jgi:peptide/nickel transport system permease protein
MTMASQEEVTVSRWELWKRAMAPRVKEARFVFSRFRENPTSFAGLALILFFVAIAVLAPYLAPPQGSNPYIMPRDSLEATPNPPSPEHPLGTLPNQWDIYYGIIWGTRSAFSISIRVIVITGLFGVALGGLAGFYGGKVDEIIMRIVDVFLAFPALVLALAFLAVLRAQTLDNIMLAIMVVWWPGYTRLVRGEILSVREQTFVEAAKAMGASDLRVIFKHVLPNAIYPMLIIATLDVGAVVLVAAALGFLGFLEPGYAEWGGMVALARNWITDPAYWYTFTFPGLAILGFVLGWNLLGDAFRDILDPRIRRGATR